MAQDDSDDSNIIDLPRIIREAPEFAQNPAFWIQNPELYKEYILNRDANEIESRRRLSPALYKIITSRVLKQRSIDIELSKITEEPIFRLIGRNHRDAEDDLMFDAMKEQIEFSKSQLHPLIVLKKSASDPMFYLIAGKKRLTVLRQVGILQTSCKVLDAEAIFRNFPLGLENDSKARLLAEVCQSISYSESIHTTALKDEQIISFYRLVRSNYGYKKQDFRTVLKMFGFSRQSPKYNNLKRLWDIACNPFMVKLIDQKWIEPKFLKKEDVINIFYHNEQKSEKIVCRIQEYIEDLKRNLKEKDEGKLPHRWSTYKVQDILRFINEIDAPGSSQITKYRNPVVKTKVSETRLHIPTITVDFANLSEHDGRMIVEVLYKLKHFTSELERFVDGHSPSNIGDSFKNSAGFKPVDVSYGSKYIEFVRKNKLEKYINIPKVVAFFKTEANGPLLKDEESDGLTRDVRNKKSLINFSVYSRERHAEDEKRREQLKQLEEQAILDERSARRRAS